MKYAPVFAFEDQTGRWHVIGVFAQNSFGIAMLRIDHDHKSVQAMPAYKAMEERMNRELEEGEVTFYDRQDGEMSSGVTRISVSDPEFLEKYRDQMVRQAKYLRLGVIRERDVENISDVLDELLDEVRQDEPGSIQASSSR